LFYTSLAPISSFAALVGRGAPPSSSNSRHSPPWWNLRQFLGDCGGYACNL